MRSGIALLGLVTIILGLGVVDTWTAQAVPVKPPPEEATDIPAMTDAAPSNQTGVDWRSHDRAGPMYPFLPELDGQAFRTNGDQASSMAYRRWLVRHRQWLESFRAGLVPIQPTAPRRPAVTAGGADGAARRGPAAADAPYAAELEFVFVPIGPAATKRSSNAAGAPVYETAFVGWLAAHFTDAGGVGEEPEFMGKVGLNLLGSFFDLFAEDDELALIDDRAVKVVRVRIPVEQNRAIVDLGHFPDALNGPFLLPGMDVGKIGPNLLRGQIGSTSSLGQALAGGEADRPKPPRAREKDPEEQPREQRTLIGFFLSILTDIATAPMTYLVLFILFCLWLVSRQRPVSGH